jgi:succinoglycan biosynthesis protein ExoA
METLISILIPCRNEERFISNCLNSVRAFTLPDGIQVEVLVLDGRSTDRTRMLVGDVQKLDARIRWIDNPGITQSCALNLGIQLARGQMIMRLDAHADYPADYLVLCHLTSVRTGAANVGGLFVTRPGNDSYGAQIVQALTSHPFGVGDSGFRTDVSEGPRDTVPFGFFCRELFDAVGIFDERLVRNQDYEFNSRIIASGRVVWLNPAIRCFYFNQPTLKGFLFKQLDREGPYGPYTWYLAPYAFALRHAVTAIFAVGVLAGVALSFASNWIAYPFAFVMLLYAALALASSIQQALRYRRPLHAVALPFAFFAYHFVHGLGVLSGVLRILTGRAPVQKDIKPWPGATHRRWKPGIGWAPVDSRALDLKDIEPQC